MKYFALVLCLVLAANAFELRHNEFVSFKKDFGKTYASVDEELHRLKVFSENFLYIETYNAARVSHDDAFLRVNRFADLTNEEYRRIHLSPKGTFKPVELEQHEFVGKNPDRFDWRDLNAVTPVKNQGQCGSCWAFSTVGAIEGAWVAAGHDLVSLSEQNLMDCSWDYGNNGCNGGWPASAMQYVVDNGGIDKEDSYPYEMESNHHCRYDRNEIGASITSFVEVKSGSEKSLTNAIAHSGPCSVAIDASQMSFQFYGGGIYRSKSCGNDMGSLDHGVLNVGYNYDGADADENQYWIVKNSWGDSWGDEGYIYIARNENNMCGVATAAVYAKA